MNVKLPIRIPASRRRINLHGDSPALFQCRYPLRSRNSHFKKNKGVKSEEGLTIITDTAICHDVELDALLIPSVYEMGVFISMQYPIELTTMLPFSYLNKNPCFIISIS